MPDLTVPRNDLHGSLSDPLLDTMNFLNEVTARFPDTISFAPGRPHEEPFDAERIAGYLRTYTSYLRDQGRSEEQIWRLLFQYGRTNGQIHELVARTVRNDEGLSVAPEALVITVGAQEGMLLVLRALIRDQADVLLVGSPCYVGITGAARLLDACVEPVPERADGGIDPQAVRDTARRVRAGGRRPRALYLVPDFANPSGTSLSLADRHRLLAVAAEQDLILVEDNPYGFFSRTGARLPTLKRLDREGRVVYLGSFAKTCLPGARVGYVIADQRVVAEDGSSALLADELSKLKSMTTVNTPALSQAVIGGMLLTFDCRLREANAERIRLYRAKLNTLLAALERRFPPGRRAELGVGWNRPDGGFFLVMTVPFDADDEALTRSARDHQVLWTPMRYFYVGDGGRRQIRLSCSALGLAEIDEGVRRLSGFVEAQTRPRQPAAAARTAPSRPPARR